MPLAHYFAGLALAVLPHVGGPLLAMASPIPPAHAPAAESAGEPLSIAVESADAHARVGDRVDYRITVRNGGAVPAEVTVRVTLPGQIHRPYGGDGATVIGNGIAWQGSVLAGQSRSYTAYGMIRRTSGDDEMAVTACAHLTGQVEPAACATRVSAAARGTANRIAWIGAGFFGALAVAGTIWLYRRIRPERLTPENAGAFYADGSPQPPGQQPGGAPSA